ncbi:hypothetical protein [Amycolatopsis anabasis]|uniref:hypothetical protein n=1 Tax=Amycolatopsis anabasis TaxID=1840409 RepID=UPI00131ECD28|nr:hypothetical protein [Amycolatopsis anabasis]
MADPSSASEQPLRYEVTGGVLAVRYPEKSDPVRDAVVYGLARILGYIPDENFRRYPNDRGSVSLRPKENGPGHQAAGTEVERGQWLVVLPAPRRRHQVLAFADAEFRARFTASEVGEHDLAAALEAEARYQIGRFPTRTYLENDHFRQDMWTHPVARAVVDRLLDHFRTTGTELWLDTDPDVQQRWEHNQAKFPVATTVRTQTRGADPFNPVGPRHIVPAAALKVRRPYRPGRPLCETGQRTTPVRLGLSTTAAPTCTGCLRNFERILTAHGETLEKPPPEPVDTSDQARPNPDETVDLADKLGEGWHLARYSGDADKHRWWVLHRDPERGYTREAGYVQQHINLSGNKSGWFARFRARKGLYLPVDAVPAGTQHRPGSSALWSSRVLAAWGVKARPGSKTPKPAWSRRRGRSQPAPD